MHITIYEAISRIVTMTDSLAATSAFAKLAPPGDDSASGTNFKAGQIVAVVERLETLGFVQPSFTEIYVNDTYDTTKPITWVVPTTLYKPTADGKLFATQAADVWLYNPNANVYNANNELVETYPIVRLATVGTDTETNKYDFTNIAVRNDNVVIYATAAQLAKLQGQIMKVDLIYRGGLGYSRRVATIK